ncbi:MAG: precorrin-6A reductase [Firmicutes bacterium]|nr:precorrin-6A reductase [Bacillota bacterium]MBQ5415097.1 precorrin-6A reductase [Bacillota bacterium]
MADIVIFAGTTEGRKLGELCRELGIEALACVATEYGEALLAAGGSLRVRTGRLSEERMEELLEKETPKLVLDATHPYAAEVSVSITKACDAAGVKLARVLREAESHDGCMEFATTEELAEYLDKVPGVVFSSLGTKEVPALSKVSGAAERIWLRILPSIDGIKTCLDAGFPAKHIICMQGPFSAELNTAMFRASGAEMLLTKDTGMAGGFPEKLAAAKQCGMKVLVIRRPKDSEGESLQKWMDRLKTGDY